MFLDCKAMTMLTVSERREYISSYISYLDFYGRDTNLNCTIFPARIESLKKIGGTVPEIFDIFSFHAAHLPAEELSCAATFSSFHAAHLPAEVLSCATTFSSFHAAHLPAEELSCAATFSSFPATPHNFCRI